MSLIKNRKRASQLIDFSGMEDKNLYPTDIDAVMEIDDKFLLIIEVKYNNAPLKLGQRLLFERLCNAWQDTGKRKAIIIVATHNTETTEDVVLKDCLVTKYYLGKEWFNTAAEKTVQEAIDELAVKWNIKKLLKKSK